MIVQACINGARPKGFHRALPLTVSDMVLESVKCLEAGASELHIHPRNADGAESLGAADTLMTAIRGACPGTLVGVSTGAWIEADEEKTRHCIANWETLPDYASVNLSEPDAPEIVSMLMHRQIGVEAGLATAADARRFLTLPGRNRVFRVLIEIEEQDQEAALHIADEIAAILAEGGICRPLLLHGFDATVWPLVRHARKMRWSTRVGLEDGKLLPNGDSADDNADLVRAAVGIFHAGP